MKHTLSQLIKRVSQHTQLFLYETAECVHETHSAGACFQLYQNLIKAGTDQFHYGWKEEVVERYSVQ